MNPSRQLLDAPVTDANPARFAGYRLLKGHELPKSGDFFAGKHGFEPWEGPAGFRADAFVNPVYRREKSPANGTPSTGKPANGPVQRKAQGLAGRRQNLVPVAFSVPVKAFNSQLG